MGLFDWKEEYSVKVSRMDSQHKKLFKLLSDFYEGMKNNDTNASILKAVRGLKQYTLTHFGEEERLMAQHNYPGIQQQKEAHKLFIDKIAGFEDKLQEGKLLLTMEITNFLKDWLKNHILKMDMNYSAFMNSKGIS